MTKRRRTRQKPFLLLELIIALSLVLLCFFPLIKPHLLIQKSTNRFLEQIQLERLSREAFVEVKTRLYEEKIAWSQLKKHAPLELENVQLFVGSGKELTLARSCQIKPLDCCLKTSSGDEHLLLGLTTEFKSRGKVIGTKHHSLLVHKTKNKYETPQDTNHPD